MSEESPQPPQNTPPPPAAPPEGGKPEGAEKKVVAGILAILLNCLGIHKFYLGYNKEGLIMLLVSLLTCGIGATVFWVIGIIEGIMYLTKSDEEFVATYIKGHKGWF